MSPSGDGLKVVVKTDNYDIANYSNCYRQVEQLFIDTFGIEPDNSCEDVGRACYMSHDPNPYCNISATSWHYEYKPEFDKVQTTQSACGSGFAVPTLTPAEQFMAKLQAARCPLTDEQIITILDIRWSKFPNNYTDGNRTKSIFTQATILSKAGVDESKAIEYLKSKFLPTGYSEEKLVYEAKRAYQKTFNLFGTERYKYKTYSEYKKSH